LLSG
jgi:hypothetical protein